MNSLLFVCRLLTFKSQKIRPHLFTFFLVTGFTFGFLEAPQAKVLVEIPSEDSMSFQKAAQDLLEMKKHVELNREQEEIVLNMFIGKHQYLEVHEATGPRWELIVKSRKRLLLEILGEEAYLRLDQAGLINQWFGSNQEI